MNKHLQKKYKMKAPKVDYGTQVTQPDLSRTVRQILVDTALGKPSPISTHPLPDDDPQAKKSLDELHALSLYKRAPSIASNLSVVTLKA